MTKLTYALKLPASQVVLHFLGVFGVAFGTQLIAGAAHYTNDSSLLALIISAAAAGIVSVAHVALGFVPTPVEGLTLLGVSLKVRTASYQFLTSLAVMFVSILGTQLVAGAAGIGSLPDAVAVLSSAIAAAVAGVASALVGLIPAPKAQPTP